MLQTETIVFTREDGSQVLVQLHIEGDWTMAERSESGKAWGPPLDGTITVQGRGL